MKTRGLVYSVLMLCLVACQCAAVRTKVEVREVWQSGTDYVRLFKEVGNPRGFDHPKDFHEEEMRRALMSLFFSRYEYFHWSNAARVFSEEQLRNLPRFFQQAFLQAGPEEEVEFYLTDRTSRMLGISKKTLLTRGRAFIKGGALHLRFESVQEETSPTSLGGELTYRPEIAWKLVPQEGQQYDTERDFLGNEPANRSWLRVDLGTFVTSAADLPPRAAGTAAAPPPAVPDAGPAQVSGTPAPAPPPAGGLTPGVPAPMPLPVPAPGEAGARDRLRQLKQMLDEGLISPQDYEKKKGEILDSL